LARIVRLAKLMHLPLLQELASMLAGFVIGLPALLWVMVLLFSIIYVLAIIFMQIMASPDSLPDPLLRCGTGDSPFNYDDPHCLLHHLYSEEFFGGLPTSMFTIFRCMLGDCSSKAGQSLVVHFSRGYGIRFMLVYCFGMVLFIFGIFNVVTSIFVETTISGLKRNSIAKKRNRLYDSRYVQAKMAALIGRIDEIHFDQASTRASNASESASMGEHRIYCVALTEEQFHNILDDALVQELFEDLDVSLFDPGSLFDMFDSDGSGLVSMPNFLNTVMQMRGDPQKTDMIASWLALRSLQRKFQQFEMLLVQNQRSMMQNQKASLALNGRGAPGNAGVIT